MGSLRKKIPPKTRQAAKDFDDALFSSIPTWVPHDIKSIFYEAIPAEVGFFVEAGLVKNIIHDSRLQRVWEKLALEESEAIRCKAEAEALFQKKTLSPEKQRSLRAALSFKKEGTKNYVFRLFLHSALGAILEAEWEISSYVGNEIRWLQTLLSKVDDLEAFMNRRKNFWASFIVLCGISTRQNLRVDLMELSHEIKKRLKATSSAKSNFRSRKAIRLLTVRRMNEFFLSFHPKGRYSLVADVSDALFPDLPVMTPNHVLQIVRKKS